MSDSSEKKNPASHLHSLNLLIAILTGVISLVTGVYTLKTNVFSPKTGNVEGVVRDEKIAKPLWHAPVEIADTNGGVIATIDTDEEGHYSLGALQAGEYQIKVSAPSHLLQSRQVKILAGSKSTLNFDLLPEGERAAVTPAAEAVSYAPYPVQQQQPMQAYPQQTQPEYPQAQGYPPAESQYADSQNHPRRWHRRQPAYDSNSDQNQNTQTSMGNVLAQVAGQMIENWTAKKKTQSGTTNP